MRTECSMYRKPRPLEGAEFPLSEAADQFRRRFFPNVTTAEWNDWRCQTRLRIRSLVQVEQVFQLSDDERAALSQHTTGLPVGITPYYASIMGLDDPSEPLRRTHIPVEQEYMKTSGEADDPLSEDQDTSTPGLVHRYPTRGSRSVH